MPPAEGKAVTPTGVAQIVSTVFMALISALFWQWSDRVNKLDGKVEKLAESVQALLIDDSKTAGLANWGRLADDVHSLVFDMRRAQLELEQRLKQHDEQMQQQLFPFRRRVEGGFKLENRDG